MGTPTPDLETVVTAVKAQMDAIASLGTVLTGFHGREDDVAFILRGGYIAAGSMNLWFIDLRSIEEFEGPASLEMYSRYQLEVHYWSLRTNNADWSKEARQKAESVRDKLANNAAVFAVSGQRQLHTPETVSIDSHGPTQIRAKEGPQMVWLTVLSLRVEARRWT